MAKFFQHILADDEQHLGIVTQLDYIDDITDEFVLYKFTDGTQCNKEFIADASNVDAFNGKFAMVELYSATAIWDINKTTVNIHEHKTHVDPNTGLEYEIPSPGVQVNGEYGGGGGEATARAKDGQIRITAIPPQYFGKKQVESSENYLLSIHPELENGTTVVPLAGKHTDVSEIVAPSDMEVADTPISKIDDITSTLVVNKTEINSAFKMVPPTLVLNESSFPLNITYNGQTYVIDENTFNGLICGNKELNQSESVKFIQDYLDNEDILITNMIEKSKKIASEIGMDLTLELPPKEVYQTIKNVYPEDMQKKFITSLAYRISVKCLVDAIAAGLSVYYDGEKLDTTETE